MRKQSGRPSSARSKHELTEKGYDDSVYESSSHGVGVVG